MPELTRYRKARRVTLVGAAINLLLALVKVIFGTIGQSHALFADGIHSFSDLLTDALVLFASRFGSRKADIDHPYGHQRIETMATVALAVILILAGFGIMLDAGKHVFVTVHKIPKFYVLLVAIFSVAANEFLYHYTLAVGKQINSTMLQANAWHHRSDAASSLVVVIGVAGALLGFYYFDAAAAVIVGLMIVKMGWSLGWSSIRELIDTGVDEKTLDEIKQAILVVPGVQAIHQLRTRSMGENILVDVHIMVASHLSVSEGHYIASQVHHQLRKQFPKIMDVTIHVDPENDEFAAPTLKLPPREQVLPQLLQAWQNCPRYENLEIVNMHYLAGKITIELRLPLHIITKDLSADDILKQYQQAITNYSNIEVIKVSFR